MVLLLGTFSDLGLDSSDFELASHLICSLGLQASSVLSLPFAPPSQFLYFRQEVLDETTLSSRVLYSLSLDNGLSSHNHLSIHAHTSFPMFSWGALFSAFVELLPRIREVSQKC